MSKTVFAASVLLLLLGATPAQRFEDVDRAAIDVWRAQSKTQRASQENKRLAMEFTHLRAEAAELGRRQCAARLIESHHECRYSVDATGQVWLRWIATRVVDFSDKPCRSIEVVTDARYPDRLAPDYVVFSAPSSGTQKSYLRREGHTTFTGKAIDVTEFDLARSASSRITINDGDRTFPVRSARPFFTDFATEFERAPSARSFSFVIEKAGSLPDRPPRLVVQVDGEPETPAACRETSTAWECSASVVTTGFVTARIDLPFPGLE